jgi:hypothetical protein
VTPAEHGQGVERLRRLSPAEVAERDRRRERLAEGLYNAHRIACAEWDEPELPRWFALHEDHKKSYRFAARAILSGQVG